MQIVLDSSSFNALATRPKKKGSRGKRTARFGTSLDDALKGGDVQVVLDEVEDLLNEWAKTSSPEFARVIYTTWSDWDSVTLVALRGPIPSRARRHFREQRWFQDTGDKLVIRIALAAREKNVVSEDPDFWDPSSAKNRGKASACVARYLRDELAITMFRIGTIVKRFPR